MVWKGFEMEEEREQEEQQRQKEQQGLQPNPSLVSLVQGDKEREQIFAQLVFAVLFPTVPSPSSSSPSSSPSPPSSLQTNNGFLEKVRLCVPVNDSDSNNNINNNQWGDWQRTVRASLAPFPHPSSCFLPPTHQLPHQPANQPPPQSSLPKHQEALRGLIVSVLDLQNQPAVQLKQKEEDPLSFSLFLQRRIVDIIIDAKSSIWNGLLSFVPPSLRCPLDYLCRVVKTDRKVKKRGDCPRCWHMPTTCVCSNIRQAHQELCLKLRKSPVYSPLLKRRKINHEEGENGEDETEEGGREKEEKGKEEKGDKEEEKEEEELYPVKVMLLMHPLEYHRSSNSGKILLGVSPSLLDVEVHLWGITPTSELIKKLKQQQNHIFFLFPSPQALSVEEFFGRVGREKSNNNNNSNSSSSSSSSNNKNKPRLTAVVLDATWNQAKTMHNVLSKAMKASVEKKEVEKEGKEGGGEGEGEVVIPSVCLSMKEGFSEFIGRKQSNVGKISTLEAVVQLFLEVEGEKVRPLCSTILKTFYDTQQILVYEQNQRNEKDLSVVITRRRKEIQSQQLPSCVSSSSSSPSPSSSSSSSSSSPSSSSSSSPPNKI